MKGNERRNEPDGRLFAADRGKMGYLLLIPFRDQNFSINKTPDNNDVKGFLSHWNGFVQNLVPSRTVPSNPHQLVFLEKGRMAFLVEILLSN
jgi:hypothetical protein